MPTLTYPINYHIPRPSSASSPATNLTVVCLADQVSTYDGKTWVLYSPELTPESIRNKEFYRAYPYLDTVILYAL